MSDDTSEIHRAVMDGNMMTAKALLAETPSLALLKDQDARTPLHWACSFQRNEMVPLLLNPSDVVGEGIEGQTGKTASQTAPKSKKKVVVDIDALTDNSGWTPLHIAAAVGDLDVVQMLLEHNPEPDVNLQTNTGQTALHYAVSKGHQHVADYLVQKAGASARIKDKKNQYPLHRAAAVGSVRMCDLLVTEGKSALNARDVYGYTALHHALAEGHGDVGVYLVKHGADYTIPDKDGHTAYEDALNDKIRGFFKSELQREGLL